MSGRRVAIFLLTALMSLWLSGCGHKVQDTVSTLNNSGRLGGTGTTVVLLPLADYTAGVTPDDSLRRQIKIQSALSYRLASHGLYTPVEEDVVQTLVDLGVIKLLKSGTSGVQSYRVLAREMESGWSQDMQAEIRRVVAMNEEYYRSTQTMEVSKVGLNRGVVQEIGRRFGADYLLRGRIVEYEVRDGHTHDPLRKGLLPFFFDISSDTLFGIAESDKYDLWQDLAVGGAIGAALGSGANTPFNAPDTERTVTTSGSHPRFATTSVDVHEEGGYSNAAGLNAGVWGAAGAAAAYLASKGGKVNQAVVQVSLMLQDAHDGRIVWANRVEKTVAPKTLWADPSARSQVDTAVEEAARSLIDDLARSLAQTRAQAQVASAQQPAATPALAPAASPAPVEAPVLEEESGTQYEELPPMPQPIPEDDEGVEPSNWGS